MYKLPTDKAPWTKREQWFFTGFLCMTLLWAVCLYQWNAALAARTDFGGRSFTIILAPTNTARVP